ncbi:hypothetical protein MIMGU_mgv1a024522mg, partial [Erythranthe guttata]
MLLEKEIYGGGGDAIGSNLWKEDMECLEWLDKKQNDAVLYINFAALRRHRRGKCNHQFLWIIRPDLVDGKGSVLPEGFLEETKGRGLLVGWCPQEKVLAHAAVGGFLTHC